MLRFPGHCDPDPLIVLIVFNRRNCMRIVFHCGSSLWRWSFALAVLLLNACAGLPAPSTAPPVHAIAASTTTELGRLTAPYRAEPPDGSTALSGIRALPQPEFALDARLQLIRRAQSSLDLQYYLLGNDKTGKLILRELRNAALRGVRVRLLLDDFYTGGLDPMLLGLASYPNVEVRLFNPFASGRESMATRWISFASEFRRLNHRMHNKLFVADGAMAIAGGRNLADEYFLRGAGDNFIDLDLMMAGSVVTELSALFDTYWNSEVVYSLARIVVPHASREQLRANFDVLTAPTSAPEPEPVPDADMFGDAPIGAALAQGRIELIRASATAAADSPLKALDEGSGSSITGRFSSPQTLADRTHTLFDTAKSDIVVISPYFIPGDAGLDQMRRLRGRGVNMTVGTNSLADTDEPLVNINYNNYRVAMVKLGVELYEVSSVQIKRSLNLRKTFAQSRGRLHAKLALIDRESVLVGSMNFDPRSARLNTELGVRVQSFELAHQLIEAFQIDEAQGVYRLKLKPGTDQVQWFSTDGTDDVFDDEPEASMIVRLKLLFFSWFVPSDLL
ncbi:putative cardiolipin synthase [Variovorax sp. GrIS 2.14]